MMLQAGWLEPVIGFVESSTLNRLVVSRHCTSVGEFSSNLAYFGNGNSVVCFSSLTAIIELMLRTPARVVR
jgi:hypothetical protein